MFLRDTSCWQWPTTLLRSLTRGRGFAWELPTNRKLEGLKQPQISPSIGMQLVALLMAFDVWKNTTAVISMLVCGSICKDTTPFEAAWQTAGGHGLCWHREAEPGRAGQDQYSQWGPLGMLGPLAAGSFHPLDAVTCWKGSSIPPACSTSAPWHYGHDASSFARQGCHGCGSSCARLFPFKSS